MTRDKISLAQLEDFRFKAADILRGKMDPSDFKEFIFGMLPCRAIWPSGVGDFPSTMSAIRPTSDQMRPSAHVRRTRLVPTFECRA